MKKVGSEIKVGDTIQFGHFVAHVITAPTEFGRGRAKYYFNGQHQTCEIFPDRNYELVQNEVQGEETKETTGGNEPENKTAGTKTPEKESKSSGLSGLLNKNKSTDADSE